MGLVATWLKGIGLEYAVPSFVAAGIDNPSSLAAISVDYFEALGVTDSEDRRKLFFLIQRIKMAVEQKDGSIQQVDGVLAKTMGGNKALSREESIKPDLEMSPKRNDNDALLNINVTATKENNDDNNHAIHGEGVTSSPKQQQQQQQRRNKQQQQHRLSSPRNHHSHSHNKTPQELLDDLLDDEEYAYLTPQEDDDDDDNEDDDNDITNDKDDDSDWEEEEEEFADTGASADDEASSVPDRTRRTSRRLLEKQRSTATADSTTEDEDLAGATAAATTTTAPKHQQQQRRRRQSQLVQPPKRSTSAAIGSRRKSDNSVLMNHRTHNSRTDSSAAESSSGGEYTYNSTTQRRSSSSGLPVPTSSRRSNTLHQQPHKPKSMRTGKQLSAIPANKVAPMSPLVDLKMNSPQKGEQLVQLPVGNRRRSSSTDSLSHRRSLTTRRSSGSLLPRHQESSSAVPKSPKKHRQSFSRQSRSMFSISNNNNNTSSHRRTSSVMARNNSNHHHSSDNINSSSNTSFKSQIEALRDENNADYELFDRPTDTDSIPDYDNNNNSNNYIEDMRIRVVVRKRPMSTAEITAAGDIDVIHPLCYTSFGKVLVYYPKTKVDLTKSVETLSFAFDNVFDEYSTNVQIYERTVRPLIPSLFEGQWASVFAYGQTGSGKTFTMMGNTATGGSKNGNNSSSSNTAQDPVSNLGLYYMAALDLFQAMKTPGFEQYRLAVSLFEIYGGKLLDLLNDRTQIKCLEDSQGKIRFPGLTEHAVTTADDLMTLIEDGGRNRSTGTTSRNADSSRSHAVLQLHLMDSSSSFTTTKQRHRRRCDNQGATAKDELSRLTFIDLAGSERGADTATSSRATQLEGAEINTSLLALKEVIRALATGDSMVHVPFRGSKLTQVLKESFVGKEGRSVMIACVSPNIGNVETTLNTLRYADRVKERNAETGEMATCNSNNSNNHAKTKNIQRVRNAVEEEEDEEEEFAQSSNHSADSNTSGLLDELLASPDASMTGKSSTTSRHQSSRNKNNSRSRKIAERLIADHKSAMQTMLAMVKDEMDLVNEADGDRNGLGDYITKLSAVHEEQMSIIACLRQHLLDFRIAQSALNDGDDNLSEESFEDLRD